MFIFGLMADFSFVKLSVLSDLNCLSLASKVNLKICMDYSSSKIMINLSPFCERLRKHFLSSMNSASLVPILTEYSTAPFMILN